MIKAVNIDVYRGHTYQTAFVHRITGGYAKMYRITNLARLTRLQAMQAALLDTRSPDERAQDDAYTASREATAIDDWGSARRENNFGKQL